MSFCVRLKKLPVSVGIMAVGRKSSLHPIRDFSFYSGGRYVFHDFYTKERNGIVDVETISNVPNTLCEELRSVMFNAKRQQCGDINPEHFSFQCLSKDKEFVLR